MRFRKSTGSWNAIQDLATRYVKEKKDIGRWRTQGNGIRLCLRRLGSLIEDREILSQARRCHPRPPVKEAREYDWEEHGSQVMHIGRIENVVTATYEGSLYRQVYAGLQVDYHRF